MTFARALLKAKSVGVRKFRDSASRFIRTHQFLIITEHGSPASVLLPYNDVLEMVDVMEEMEDKDLLKTIAQGRRALHRGAKGIPASESFRKNKA